MSILIAVCGESYAAIAADSRLTLLDRETNEKHINDNFHKVFQLNDHLIFAGGGQFYFSEPVPAPFIGQDLDSLSLEKADNLIQGYMSSVFEKLAPIGNRSYILCGRNNSNEMCLFQYNFNLIEKEKEIQKYNASQSDGDYFCVALPPTLSDREAEYLARVEWILNNAENGTVVLDHLKKIIIEVIGIDESVGGTPEIVTLH